MKVSNYSLFAVLFSGVLSSNTVLAKPACPSQGFNQFIKVFANDELVQKAFTKAPLKVINFYETDFKQPYIVHRLKKDEITYPVFLSDDYRRKEGVALTVKRKNSKYTQVFTKRLIGSGADNLRYDFQRSDGCWYLVSRFDYST